MSEAIEVDATTMEDAIERSSGLDQLVASITGEAERLAAEYQPREIVTEDDYKQSKRERAGARKDIAALKARYNERMRAIKDAVREADERVKGALAPLDAVDAGYKREVDEYEDRWKMERLAALAEEYADFAPDLVPLVPFERLRQRFGTEKGRQWDARSMSEQQAMEAMRKAVESVAADERTITDSPWDAVEKAAIKADFFSTLDLSGALRRAQAEKEQRERVAQLERERAERAAEAERAARERQERQERLERELAETAAPEPTPEQPKAPSADKFLTRMTPEEYVAALEQTGTPPSLRSSLLQHAATTKGSPAPGERVPDYVFAGYGNAAQADAFTAWCDRAGVSRRVKLLTHGRNYKLSAS